MVAFRIITLSALASIVCTTVAIASPADQALKAAHERRQDDDQTVSTTLITETSSGTATTTATTGTTDSLPTAVTNCHTHDDTPYCVADGAEWEVETDVDEDNLPDGYENCRPNGDDADEIACAAADGAQVVLHREGDDHTSDDSSSSVTATGTTTALTVAGTGGAATVASSQVSESAAAAANTNAASAVGPAPASLLALVIALFAL